MDYAITLMYADDANNLPFTACSFPRLQHDMNVADSKQAHVFDEFITSV